MTDEESMGRWFSQQTKPQLARYNQRMADAFAYRNSPRWERERISAQAEFRRDTETERVLYEMAMSDLGLFGEIQPATDDAISEIHIHHRIAAE